ncbi:MAG: PilN domain-containing protein [Gammaproteobacteria bacterium]|nr:PilN domain-containing protein [Gammaproteobacteria bacterium]
MTTLNLLPWREGVRARRRRRFVLLLAGVALAGCAVVYGLGLGATALVAGQLDANESLQTTLASLDSPLAELDRLRLHNEEMRSRIRVIRGLQAQRSVAVILLEQVVRSMPAEVSLLALRRRDEALVIEGEATSYAGVTELMRRLEESEAFAAAVLNDVAAEERAAGEVRFLFDLNVALSVSLATAGEGHGVVEGQ